MYMYMYFNFICAIETCILQLHVKPLQPPDFKLHNLCAAAQLDVIFDYLEKDNSGINEYDRVSNYIYPLTLLR